jgi:putative DNA modification/repair radical SAM protein
MELGEKLEILAAGARYDASCASSGSSRRPGAGGFGAGTPAGVCHSWTGDGRCVSLLKLLYSNSCRLDCAYCANRASNEQPRVSFSPDELARLTVSFYKRNYIEGLFLSSGVFADPDIVMERLTEVARLLRESYGFGGYIHLKVIPGSGERALRRAGLYADRLSANIELPTRASLERLAPQKSGDEILGAMRSIGGALAENAEDRRRLRKAPLFASAGQSTQIIVGATDDDDGTLLRLSSSLYGRLGMRRVYYSAFLPVAADPRLPAVHAPPLQREHRLYQADWLLRFYGFSAEELIEATGPRLPADIDPKTAWALGQPSFFPVELRRADYQSLLRVPGIGTIGAARILATRRAGGLRADSLAKMGVVMKRARHFLSLDGRRLAEPADSSVLRPLLADRQVEVGIGPAGEASSSSARFAFQDRTRGTSPRQPEFSF